MALHGMAHSFIELDRLWFMWSVWLVFCDCGFHSVCLLMEKDKISWKLPNGRDWLRWKLGLFLMGGTMVSKSLIQFSADGQGCVPSLLFDQTMLEVMKIMVTSFKRSHACTTALSAPNPAAGHCWPMLPLETPGYSCASLGIKTHSLDTGNPLAV